jgi:hypothetical protein
VAHRIIEILGRLAGSFICSADAMGQEKPTFESDPKGSPGTILPLQTVQRAPPASGRWCVFCVGAKPDRDRLGARSPGLIHALSIDYLAPAPLRKSDGDMPASLRNDLLKALSEPKPESMATRSTLASWCISSACA